MASEVWFQCLKNVGKLCVIKITGHAASANSEEAILFVSCLGILIEEGGYHKQQVFHVSDMDLCWKHCIRPTLQKNGFRF
jgi:hypothetical protein